MEEAGKSEKVLRRWLFPGCLLVFFVLTWSFWWDAVIRPILFSGPAKAREVACQTNMKRMGLAMSLYLQDWSETFPPADRWQNVAQSPSTPNEKPSTKCPSGKTDYSYGLNIKAAGTNRDSVSDFQNTVMFFETDSAKPNAVGSRSDLPADGRHAGRDTYVFMDGYVKVLPRTSKVIW